MWFCKIDLGKIKQNKTKKPQKRTERKKKSTVWLDCGLWNVWKRRSHGFDVGLEMTVTTCCASDTQLYLFYFSVINFTFLDYKDLIIVWVMFLHVPSFSFFFFLNLISKFRNSQRRFFYTFLITNRACERSSILRRCQVISVYPFASFLAVQVAPWSVLLSRVVLFCNDCGLSGHYFAEQSHRAFPVTLTGSSCKCRFKIKDSYSER